MKRGIAIIPKEGEEEKFSGEEIGLEFAKVLKNAVDDQESDYEEEDETDEEKFKEQDGQTEIQKKLCTKVLPILERHITDAKETKDEEG